MPSEVIRLLLYELKLWQLMVQFTPDINISRFTFFASFNIQSMSEIGRMPKSKILLVRISDRAKKPNVLKPNNFVRFSDEKLA